MKGKSQFIKGKKSKNEVCMEPKVDSQGKKNPQMYSTKGGRKSSQLSAGESNQTKAKNET